MSALFACGYELLLCSLLVMSKSFVASLIFVALAIPAPAAVAAPAPLILKPTSAWQVDYGDEKCRLVRQFGEGKQTAFLFMDLYGPNEYFQLTIAGKFVPTSVQKGDANIQFGPIEEEQKFAFVRGTIGKEPALLFSKSGRIAPPNAAELSAIKDRSDDEWINLQPISEDRKKAVKYLRIGKPLRKPVTLETGSLRGPLAALDRCVENLVASWGVDVEKHKTLTRKAEPLKSPGDWIKSSDYPENMLRAGQPALVSFRLSIGPDGIPTACHIQATTRPKEFDNAVCKSVMRRARFSPALDATGQPLMSYYQNNVYFHLP
jgi:hypothetical protein